MSRMEHMPSGICLEQCLEDDVVLDTTDDRLLESANATFSSKA